ncbi:hypothetical protein EW145_g8034 [Phellinidium pouzarii]|uniref:Uncharacterized protein n=1 Tax=Phellinidium pouzarii TaxID=167371 RepID=A0A4S4KBM9_9AGAM|nr:hypothetical protein EW145_g8034 [Phellinidium pouzarii]
MSSTKGVAIITGAAQGIGRGIALRLAADGYDISLNDLPSNRENLEAVADLISQSGRRVLSIAGDVSKEEDVQEIVDKTVNNLGGLDVMVANAGILRSDSLIVNMAVDEWDQLFNVNTKGTMLCYKHAAIQMIKQGRGGRIIGACSIAGKMVGAQMPSAYAASKFAVRGLTQSAALELGQFGITVNAYTPGTTYTSMFEKAEELNTTQTGAPAGSLAKIWEGKLAMRRMGKPDDLAALVSFLVKDETSFITGQSIIVDGGYIFD